MLLRVLGPLELVGDAGPVALAAAKPRTLLAALAVRRGVPQGADVLMDALWGEQLPASAAKLLQVYVSQLRRALPRGAVIRTKPAGYLLEIDDRDLDSAVFERAVSEGRAAASAGNHALAASMFRRALDLWRGPAYADVRYEEFARAEIERLERLRALAINDRIESDLCLGRHTEILGELRGLLATEPTNEALARQAMLAAYRSGGADEALGILDGVRRALREEVGEGPSLQLEELGRRIANGDPGLAVAGTEEAGLALPVAPNPLVGRERELAELRRLVERPGVRLVSLTGAGGSGKSRLALALATELADRFANGVVLVELASLRDPGLVLATVAQAIGVDPGADPLRAVTAALAQRQLLLVLDNLEHLRDAAPELVRLLTAAPLLVVIVTTRVVLHVSGEHVYPVGPLADEAAIELFAERAQARDPTFVLDAATHPVIARIVRRVDGLPLPIELAAARVRSLGLRGLDARLASRLTVLTGGPRDLPARQVTLRKTLAWSMNLLEPPTADVLAGLAVFPAGCSPESATDVAGADDESLAVLVDHHLVQGVDVDGERRYRLLETVREYAYELLGDRRGAAESRLVDCMVALVQRSGLMDDMGPNTNTLRILDAEIDTLRDAFRHAAQDEDPSRELALAAGIWRYWWIRGLLVEGRAILEGILARRGVVLTTEGIRTVRAAASLSWSLGDREAAANLAGQALDAAERGGDILEQQTAHNLLGVLAMGREALDVAEHHLVRAIELADGFGLGDLANTAKTNLGILYLAATRIDDARTQLQEVLEFRTRAGRTEGVAFVRLNLGEVEFAAGRLAEAEDHFTSAAATFRELGFRARIANALQGLAAVEVHTGRPESAARRLGLAATLLGDTGWGADGTALAPDAISGAREALGDQRFEELFRQGVAEDGA